MKGMKTIMNERDSTFILQVENVCKSFPGVKALDKVTIQVQRGVVHGIVGENGAGKSTLMKILSGVYTKDEGEIIFDGEIVEHTTPIQSLARGLSIIYQEFNLVNTMSVGENIFLGRFKEVKGMKGTHEKAKKLLEQIGCSIDTHTMVSELSVSQKQMVEIAKALSFHSKLIIMDEPSSSLTNDELKGLYKIINDLKKEGISIIYISHKLDEIFELCDTVTIMRDGSVVDTKPIAELEREEMITKMVGRTIEKEYPERPDCVGEKIFEIQNLNTKKLHDIHFSLHRGEILGLVGLVGAGRTEIIRAIFGADKVKGHEIWMSEKPTKIRDPRDAIAAGIALVPEDRKLQGLILSQSVETNIVLAVLKKYVKFGFLDKSVKKQIAEKHVEALAIKTPGIKTKVINLSGGNQQKCIVGRWMETKPEILIMDEPTRGIDVGAKYEIYLLMKKIVESGSSIILISSELPEVLNMSNRILTICDGKISGEFNPEEVSVQSIMERVLG